MFIVTYLKVFLRVKGHFCFLLVESEIGALNGQLEVQTNLKMKAKASGKNPYVPIYVRNRKIPCAKYTYGIVQNNQKMKTRYHPSLI